MTSLSIFRDTRDVEVGEKRKGTLIQIRVHLMRDISGHISKRLMKRKQILKKKRLLPQARSAVGFFRWKCSHHPS